jgi:hypothetical protein
MIFAERINIVCPACGQAWVSSHPVDSPFSGVVIHAECKDCRKGRKKNR